MQCCLKAQDPGSGRKISAKWHGTGACHGVLSQKPGTKNGIIRPTILFLAWLEKHLSKHLNNNENIYITSSRPCGSGERYCVSCSPGGRTRHMHLPILNFVCKQSAQLLSQSFSVLRSPPRTRKTRAGCHLSSSTRGHSSTTTANIPFPAPCLCCILRRRGGGRDAQGCILRSAGEEGKRRTSPDRGLAVHVGTARVWSVVRRRAPHTVARCRIDYLIDRKPRSGPSNI